ncbi:hypothetical protein [Bradyrhizobium sp. sBnM-33]|uniref:hypothetical protein n=1 Tax=Bradyrhizobium sp. sBnM-33 TaxID=2831780 RepID=UPI001BCEC1E8|nr:hypothetical protein [Bradyrhizobium sp. sBnM-33]WOH48260.1 hypothetical protein RX328_29575 [Bradyrhizobium sp. sBnM-33]
MTSSKLPPRRFSLYCDLMEEIKKRGDVVRTIVQGRIPVPKNVALELAYLQLRMICELIALACLTAHGDVPQTTSKRLTKAYNADQIMKALGNLHPDFYPVPGRQVRNQAGKVVEVVPVDQPHLTKRELQRLYGECGDFLHRGNIEQLMKGRRLPDFSEIDTWFKKITVLLNHHQIQLFDRHRQLWVMMHAESDGKVHAFELERLEGPILSPRNA